MKCYPSGSSPSVRSLARHYSWYMLIVVTLMSSNYAEASDLAWQFLLPMWPIVDVGDPIPGSLINEWRSKSLKCPSVKGQYDSFPTKAPDSNNPCNDGDMTLFNGILCAAGVPDGCTAVKQAQDSKGRWYRSPRLRVFNQNNCASASFGAKGNSEPCKNTLSPDMGLGIMLYVATQKDYPAFRRWAGWMESNASTTRVCVGICNCQIRIAWPRVCNNDYSPEKPGDPQCSTLGHCALRPGDALDLDSLAHVSGMTWPINMSTFVLASNSLVPAPYLLTVATTDSQGYPLHLDALRVLLRMIERNPSLRSPNLPDLPDPDTIARLDWPSLADAGPGALHAAALTIALKDQWNPFFALLAYGPTKEVRSNLIDSCPAAGSALVNRDQWIIERAGNDSSHDKTHSMGWDCVFVASLFNRMRVKQDFATEALEKFRKALDPANAAIAGLSLQVQAAQAGLDAANYQIDQEQQWFDKVNAFLTSGYDSGVAVHRSTLNSARNLANALPAQIASAQAAASAKQAALTPIPQQVCALYFPVKTGCGSNPVYTAAASALGALQSNVASFQQQLTKANNTIATETKTLLDLDKQRTSYMQELASQQHQQALEAARKVNLDSKKKLDTLQPQLASAQTREKQVSAYLSVWKGAN